MPLILIHLPENSDDVKLLDLARICIRSPKKAIHSSKCCFKLSNASQTSKEHKNPLFYHGNATVFKHKMKFKQRLA